MGSMPSFPRRAPTLLRAGIARQPSGAPQALTLRGVRAQSPWPASREWPPPACRRRSRGGALRPGAACTPHRPPARRGRSGRCVWRRCPSRSGRRGPATRRRAPGPRAARRPRLPEPPGLRLSSVARLLALASLAPSTRAQASENSWWQGSVPGQAWAPGPFCGSVTRPVPSRSKIPTAVPPRRRADALYARPGRGVWGRS